MNRTRLLAGLAAASLMLIAGAASAQTAPTPNGRPDADRRVSKAEFVEARLAPLIAMDADKDGTVTVAERTAARQARAAAAVARRFDRLDTDKDGAVSRAEFEAAARPAARGARGARPEGRRHVGRRMGPAHARMGAPRPHEGVAAAPIVIAEVRAKVEAAFDRLDTNKDGFLVQAERQAGREAARTALRERMQARRAEAGPRGEGRREVRRLRRENVAPTAPASPASE